MEGTTPQDMAFFDPYLFSDVRSDEDLANLAFFGTTHVVTSANAPHRFDHADQVHRYLHHLLYAEAQRLRDAQLTPLVALGVHPRAAPLRPLRTLWPQLLTLAQHPNVVALGELGWVDATPQEYTLVETQLDVAASLGLPCLIRLPLRRQRAALRQLLACLRRTQVEPQRVMITNPDEEMLPRLLEAGFKVALQPRFARLSMAGLMAALRQPTGASQSCLSAALTEGPADVLAIRHTVDALHREGLEDALLKRLSHDNAALFFARGATLT